MLPSAARENKVDDGFSSSIGSVDFVELVEWVEHNGSDQARRTLIAHDDAEDAMLVSDLDASTEMTDSFRVQRAAFIECGLAEKDDANLGRATPGASG